MRCPNQRRIYQRDKTKHISPKIFYTHELQESNQIDVKQIHSTNNFEILLTKIFPTDNIREINS